MNDRLPRAASAAQSSLRVCVCSLGVFLSRKRMCCGFAAVAHCRFKWLKLAGALAKSTLADGLLRLRRDVNKDFYWLVLTDVLSILPTVNFVSCGQSEDGTCAVVRFG